MIDLIAATTELYGDCSQEVGSIEIKIKGVIATESQMLAITARAIELEALYNSKDYARKRRTKYNLLNQDEMRFDDLVNSTTTWHDAIVAIKLEYPK